MVAFLMPGVKSKEPLYKFVVSVDAIEKMRQQLTANKDVDFYIESLIEEIDLNFHVKRNDFEAWI